MARRRRDVAFTVLHWQAPSGAVEKVVEALVLIQNVGASSHDELVQNARRVLVTPAPGASFWWLTSTIVVPVEMATQSNEVRVALALVHEARHAMIAAQGEVYSPKSAEDIERRCIMAQIEFVGRLEQAGFRNTEAWRAHYERKMVNYQYSEAAIYEAKNDFLQREGVPRWVRALHRMVFRSTSEEGGPNP